MINTTQAQFKTRYVYDAPSNAGPFKGQMWTTLRYKRGDSIRAPFGSATVVSCRQQKEQ